MASTGDPASIITQVNQNQQLGPVQLGSKYTGQCDNIILDLRGTRFCLSRDELLTLPEFVLLSLFPNGLMPEGNSDSCYGEISNPVDYDPKSLQYMLDFFRRVAHSIPIESAELANKKRISSNGAGTDHLLPNALAQDRAGIIVLREDLDFYAIPPRPDVSHSEMTQIKQAARTKLLNQNRIFSGLRRMEKPGSTEQNMIDMLTKGGFNSDDEWGHRAGEPKKAVINSIALARLRTTDWLSTGTDLNKTAAAGNCDAINLFSQPDGGGGARSNGTRDCPNSISSATNDLSVDEQNQSAVNMAQKLLLFWRKPARRCWWEEVHLEDIEGITSGGKLKVWVRRVWTLEMSVIGLR